MYQRILIAADGSNASDLALNEAVKLAAKLQSQLRIVHVIDVRILSGESAFLDAGDLEKALVESGERVLQKAAATAGNAGIKAETKLLKIEDFRQRIADGIVGESAAWPAELIVVGTHGRRGLSHLFLGSVAEGIVRISQVPVLLIRGR
ncbi:Universal stress protein [Burkholderiales bacterium]|jgi:nucleotide-binding universal stress UspA family protein|nr:Universal stress protein [Burkholderiales bacterium]